MRIGDHVKMRYSFSIIQVKTNSFLISVPTERGVEYLHIPIYLSSFGINLPEFNFVYPGSVDDENHPEFYKRSHIDPVERKAIYIDRFQREVYLDLSDPDFKKIGKYYVVARDKGGTITKFASKKSPAKIQEELIQWSNEKDLSGDMISGMVVNIRYCKATSTDKDGDEYAYVDDLEEALKLHAHDNPKFNLSVIIRDIGTLIEYPIPYNLLKMA